MPKDISIVIPIYNDSSVIGNTIDNVLMFFATENLNGEIIIVNDGGPTEALAPVHERMKINGNIRLLSREENKGKGFSVREGILISAGKNIFYTDADLPYGTSYIKSMNDLLNAGVYDLVLANRNLSNNGAMKKVPLIRKLTHHIYAAFVGALLINFSDTQAGLKGMSRIMIEKIVPKLTIDRFAFDVELILLAQKNGFKVGEQPVVLQQSGKSNLKIIFDAPQMIKDVFRIIRNNHRGLYDLKK